MKNSIFKIIAISCTLLFSLSTYAQTTDDMSIMQDKWGMEKKEIVGSYMQLSPEEATVFWQKYDTYEVARKELAKNRFHIINEYAENYTELSSDKAKELIQGAIANNMAQQKLIKKTFKSMSKSIPPVQAALFVQIENYLLVVTQMAVQESIFFIGELEDSMLTE